MNCEHCKLPRGAWHDCMASLMTEVAQLKGNHSLAEEGLANYAQEVAQLKLALDTKLYSRRKLESDNARMRELLVVASEALTAFTTTYNGRPSRFAEAEKTSGEIIMAAADKVDAFLYPELCPSEPQDGCHAPSATKPEKG